jgi:hypothetical protein
VITGASGGIALLDALSFNASEGEKTKQKSYTCPQTLIQRQRQDPGQFSIGTTGQFSIGPDSLDCHLLPFLMASCPKSVPTG